MFSEYIERKGAPGMPTATKPLSKVLFGRTIIDVLSLEELIVVAKAYRAPIQHHADGMFDVYLVERGFRLYRFAPQVPNGLAVQHP